MQRTTKIFATWLATFSLLAASLAPAVSHVIAAEITSKPNVDYLYNDDQKSDGLKDQIFSLEIFPDDIHANHHQPDCPLIGGQMQKQQNGFLNHCPFCQVHAFSFAALFSVYFLLLPSKADIVFNLSKKTQYVSIAWIIAPSRAPPDIS